MNSLRTITLIILLFLIGGCSGSQNLESLFAPDEDLEQPSPSQTKNNSNSNPNPNPNPNPNNNTNNSPQELKLPANFPIDIPIYQEAKLVTIEDNTISWRSQDPLNLITSYYQQELPKQNWQITSQEDNLIVAQKKEQDRSLRLSFAVENNQTKLVINQEKISPSTPKNNPVKTNNSNQNNQQESSHLEQLVRLDIIPEDQQLKPHDPITRREYARWLVKANNLLHSDVNSKQIRLANPQSKPAFSDVGNNDPDFAAIQGLAEAGLIPSRLTQDTTAIAFRPDKPLTREDLITWKVPLDYRQNLPTATLDSIKETWGFQDASQTTPQSWAELYIDWQNGENSNIRKAFGYTTLLQPKKTVTYAEAATVLSSFGYQGEVIFLQNFQPQESNN